MKLSTWNVNSLAVRLPQLMEWLAANPVDAIVLQETKLTDDKFPHEVLLEAGYQVQWFGQKTYNGVALISRQPATDIVKNITGFADEQARAIAGTLQDAQLGEGRGAGLKQELNTHPQTVLMGDFNIAPTDDDVHDPVAWKDQIHCTVPEREHFQQLLGLGLADAFRLFEQPPKLWSWWDYRNLAFRKNQGLRIDHILVSEALKSRVKSCVIDKQPRRNERPSDHAPVVVELGN